MRSLLLGALSLLGRYMATDLVSERHDRRANSGEKARRRAPKESCRKKGFSTFGIRKLHVIVVGCLMVSFLGGLALLLLPKDLYEQKNRFCFNPAFY